MDAFTHSPHRSTPIERRAEIGRKKGFQRAGGSGGGCGGGGGGRHRGRHGAGAGRHGGRHGGRDGGRDSTEAGVAARWQVRRRR
jgi:hypothetical protein